MIKQEDDDSGDGTMFLVTNNFGKHNIGMSLMLAMIKIDNDDDDDENRPKSNQTMVVKTMIIKILKS